MKQIKGFVIVPPGENAWQLGYWTFAPTAGEAWYRKLGHEVADIERPRRIQAWHDRGHRLREATLIIHPGDDELELQGNPNTQPNNRNDQRIT
jgi:hypothetical protein